MLGVTVVRASNEIYLTLTTLLGVTVVGASNEST